MAKYKKGMEKQMDTVKCTLNSVRSSHICHSFHVAVYNKNTTRFQYELMAARSMRVHTSQMNN